MTRHKRAGLGGREHAVVALLFAFHPCLKVVLALEAQVHDVHRHVVSVEMSRIEEHVVESKAAAVKTAFELSEFEVRGIHHFVELGLCEQTNFANRAAGQPALGRTK